MIKIPQITLSKRFLLLYGVLVLFTAWSARTFYVRQENADLEIRLREKATFINNFYSYLIGDALIRKDDITLLQIINRLEEDPEIVTVNVVDQTGEIRYHADAQKVGLATDDPQVQGVLKTGEAFMSTYSTAYGKAMALVSPLKVQGASLPLGAVRIDFTYRHIDQMIHASMQRYWFIIFGALVTCAGLVGLLLNRWVLFPLQKIRASVSTVNAALPESTLPESPDEVGQLCTAINELVQRFKNEGQLQSSNQQNRGDQEKLWVQQLAQSFMPEARVLLADKDNRVIVDTGNGVPSVSENAHLMDLIKDSNFANLLTAAFQKEGEVVKGAVTFQEKAYSASILSVPMQQTAQVKTMIALMPPIKETP